MTELEKYKGYWISYIRSNAGQWMGATIYRPDESIRPLGKRIAHTGLYLGQSATRKTAESIIDIDIQTGQDKP